MPNIESNSLFTSSINSNEKMSEKAKIMSGFTNRGTRIVKPGEQMDKNAFLKILSAELSNQDPMNAKDGTEFVAQMAQFAGLEQMANLNTTMRLTGAVSFVNKYVMLNKLDMYGNLSHGLVTGVSKDGDQVKLNVLVGEKKDKDGNKIPDIKQFKVEDIIELVNMPTNNEPINKENNKEYHKKDKAI